MINAEVPTTRTRGPLGAVIAGLLQRDPRARLSGVQAAALLSGEPPTPPTGMVGTATRTVTAPDGRAGAGRRPVARAAAAWRRWRWWWGWARGCCGRAARRARRCSPTARAATSPRSPRSPPAACRASSPSGGSTPPPRPATTRTTSRSSTPLDLFDTQLDMPYPGRETVAAGAGPACALIFNSGKIAGADKAALRVAALAPSAEAFAYRSSPTSSFSTRRSCAPSTPPTARSSPARGSPSPPRPRRTASRRFRTASRPRFRVAR